ncbi:MAG TPA: Gfo/Idh/MocA family oxidoreductase [Candidatus Hydrogenedentes bacterium]|nr:Gfo/Idh/MocA family oxidoreductase [Candidatus Hydrogenedentota bacterium]HQE83197.1 Gfo/Idh/MocA family oxidoreductase [Candidatus Hydrogenedentota bacterium]HQH52606.1 Gfo/Idh/MocA family oxidoreductase [Candidatus Hydrogenedentota bacterium]
MTTVQNQDKTRIAVIGVGQIGKVHLQNYRAVANAEIVAIADSDEAEARRVADHFNIPSFYGDAHSLLARDDIDAVDICLHNNLHMPYTVAALKAGKHVYCEKPMAGSYRDAKAMLDEARKQGKMLSIQLSTLFSRETRAAKVLIDGGHLGRLYHARSTGYRRRGRPYVDGYGTASFVKKEIAAGGALFDMGVYHIAQILYLLGNPKVMSISGGTYQETEMDALRLASSGYDVEELGVGFVRFAGGVSLDIIEAWAIHLNPFEGSFVLGSEGGVRLDPFGYYRNIGDMEASVCIDLGSFDYRQHTVHCVGDAYDSPQHHWVAALQGRAELLPTDEIALNAMLISEGIYLSNRLGREVRADEVGGVCSEQLSHSGTAVSPPV